MSQSDIVKKGQKMQGRVKQVYSGDRIVLYGPIGKQGVPLEKILQLICLRAPRTGIAGEKKDENNGQLVKHYLRKLLIGQQVDFYIEEKMNGYDLASVYFQGEEITCRMLSDGMGQFQFKKDNKNIEIYKSCEERAKTSKKGIWADQQQEGVMVEVVDDVQSFVKKNKQIEGVVDYVNNNNVLNIQFTKTDGLGLFKAEMDGVVIPKLSQDNQNQLKYLLDSNVLQRDVSLKLKGVSNNGKFVKVEPTILNGSMDIQKEIIRKGFGRINIEGVKDQKLFKEYQHVQEEAQNKKIGIWSDFVKSEKLQDNEFVGQVQEVMSGDSLVILNLGNNQSDKYFLSNYKAPSVGNPKKNEPEKPYAFESKEQLRKMVIGKKANITIDYVRKVVSKETEQELTMKFVTIVINNNCVQVLLAKQGLGNVLPSKQSENCSAYFQEMKAEEDIANSKKLNIFNPKPVPVHRFNEISQKNGKQFESFVKGDGKISAVVDFVLSGQRLKVRLNKHNAQILMNLQGIKTLSNDANILLNKEWSNKAMAYTKLMVNQRDVEVEIENCDNKGVFYGTLWLNNRNFNADLIEQGLAHVFSKSKYQNEYSKLEKVAKSAKKGIWGSNLQLSGQESKMLNYSDKVIATEIRDPQNIYLQSLKAKQLPQIEKVIDQVNPKLQGKLENPIKKDTPCLALFDVDNLYYRARIIQKKGNGYQVHFSDYGNQEVVATEDILKLPQSITGIPDQCDLCQFAYINTVSLKHELGHEIRDNLYELLSDKTLYIDFISQDDQHKQAVFYVSEPKEPKNSVNAKLVQVGYAKVQENLPEEWAFLADLEEKAMNKKVGLWMYDDEEDDE